MIHSFDTQIAEKYSIEKAVLLHFFYYWIEKNRANNKHLHEGKYWTYNTADAFFKLFPYLKSRQKIARLLREMAAENLIEVANFNKTKQDQTKWYALTGLSIKLLTGQMDRGSNNDCSNLNTQCSNLNTQCSNLNNHQCSNLNNDIKETVNNQLTNTVNKKSRKKEKIEILTFGEKVKLPLPAYEKLVAEFGELKIVEYIEKINTYLTTTEKGLKRGEYKNYAQTIKNWIASDSNGSSVGYSQQQAHAVAAWRQKAEFLSAGKKSGDWWAQPGEDNQTWAKRVVIWLKVGLDKHWDITRQNWRMETESQKAMVRKLYFQARDILQGRAA